MESCHLLRLLAHATLLLAVHRASADPAQPIIPRNPIVPDTDEHCPSIVEVGERYGLAHVRLQDTLEFSLNPNMPLMSMRFVGDDVLYKATVDGTMVKLSQCDVQESNCTIVEEGGTKSKDLLVVNKWNAILVKYNNGEITVDVNMRSSVMGGHMRMTKGNNKSGGGGGQVTFMVPPATPSYMARLMIPCSDGVPQVQTELPIFFPSTPAATKPSLPARPYEACPLYQVEPNHGSGIASLVDNLTLAVYPSHASLHLLIGNDHLHFTVTVYDQSVLLLQCSLVAGTCEERDEINFFIEPKRWNFVTFSLQNDQLIISIRVNEQEGVLTTGLLASDRKGLGVLVLASEELPNKDSHYVAFVNVKCEVTEQKTTWPAGPGSSWPATQRGLPTNAPIMEITTTEPTTSTGISRNVSIVVGVLVGLLLIIVLAIIISNVVKKRRSAAITEHSPLQNQCQQLE